MAYQTWINYGYGICVSDLEKEVPANNLMTLIKQAPKLFKKMKKFFEEFCTESELDISEINSYDILTDFVENGSGLDCNYGGLASILHEVIKEKEDIELLVCDDFDGKNYLIYQPEYPWSKRTEAESQLTEEKLAQLFGKYLHIVTDEEITVDYRSVANGC